MELLILIALATLFYTLFDIFASQAGNKIDSNLSAVIFNGLGTIPLVLYIFYKYSKDSKIIPASSEGIFHSTAAGISIAIFSVLLIKIFEKGGLSYIVPLIYGGTVVLAALAGIAIFKEQANTYGVLGIILVAAGIGLIVFSKI